MIMFVNDKASSLVGMLMRAVLYLYDSLPG
jgi:hypothetical protein